MLAKSAEADPRNWDRRLPHVLFAYRTSPHDSTGETPFRLLYGREAVLPTDEVLFPLVECREVIVGTYLEETTAMFSDAWELARKRIKKSQEQQKKQFDKRATSPSYQVGDRVLLHMPAKTSGELRKLALPNQGPYRITKILSTGVLIIPEDRPQATPLRVNWDRLRKCPADLILRKDPAPDGQMEDPTPQPRYNLRARAKTLNGSTRTSTLKGGRCNTRTGKDPPT